ncbi:MAG TPA: TldD/PmbA family protein [Thermoanaerobaculia bacterium]|nr:TldD/PmbA family protein [Thermoanaerobaculia bacterium]
MSARGSPCSFERQLFSLEGTFTAASRRRDETRSFSFHAPEAPSMVDELRTTLTLAAQPRETMVPCGDGEMDVVLANGSAAVLFHEILSHPLEAGVASPLSMLEGARLATPELDVSDDPTRLDLFGGYLFDDEGTRARPVKLLDSGRLGHRLTDRAHAERGTSNGHARRAGPWDTPLVRSSNILVAGGHSTSEEMARRLGSGLWIDALEGGSVELASGRFRLSFPRAHRVRRGRMADECGAGTLAGDILSALKAVEPVLGRQVRPTAPLAGARGQDKSFPFRAPLRTCSSEASPSAAPHDPRASVCAAARPRARRVGALPKDSRLARARLPTRLDQRFLAARGGVGGPVVGVGLAALCVGLGSGIAGGGDGRSGQLASGDSPEPATRVARRVAADPRNFGPNRTASRALPDARTATVG